MVVLITIIHVVVALFLIVSVLLQSGKGGGVGAAFGGASTQVFGGHGAGGFLAKVTSVMAITFMVTSFVLSYMGSSSSSVVDDMPVVDPVPQVAAAPGAVADTAPAEVNTEVAEKAVDAATNADVVVDGATNVDGASNN